MTKRSAPAALPQPLSAESAAWVAQVEHEYELQPHHKHLLRQAAGCLDRVAEAQAAIDRDGLFVVDRFGQCKAHPGAAVERDQKGLFARLCRELGLDLSDDETRPPVIRGGKRGR